MLNGWRVNGKYSFEKPTEKEVDKHAWYCKKAYAQYFENAKEKIASDMEK